MQRAFIIHGWGGSPERDWMAWAKKTLSRKGYEVFIPEMPEAENPKIDPWLKKISGVVGTPRANDILIGHSIGCLAIIRYLQTLSKDQKVGKVVLVAPWQFLTLDEDEDPEIARPWQAGNVDYEKVKTKAKKFIAVFSKDDPWVPFEENRRYFVEKLSPEVVVKDKMGHFNQSEAPFLLKLLK